MWKEKFEEEKGNLKNIIKKDIDIYHIGSTSVPGIAAKPIIDIGVGISETNDNNKIIEDIKKIGYQYKGEHGIKGRKYFVKGKPEKRIFHLHLYNKNHPNLKDHILFRNYLINNPQIAKEYEKVKIRSWRKYKGKRKKYTGSKNDFIKSVLNRAKNNTTG